MSIEEDIITVLNNYSGLSALVASRNYTEGGVPPKPTYPLTITQIVNTTPTNILTGGDPLTGRLIQIDVYATSKSSLVSVANKVVPAMEAATTFQCYWDNETDLQFDDTLSIFRRVLDFTLHHTFTR